MKRISIDVCGKAFHVLVAGEVVRFAAFGEAPVAPSADPDHPVAVALQRYVLGDLHALEAITLNQDGSEFRQHVWEALRTVPAGTLVSYAELAALAGRPRAIRAAASACATNQIPLIVPCHRVVRSDGTLGGYAYGLDLKNRLIVHEKMRHVSS